MPRMERMEVNRMEKLEKCPFCGGKAVFRTCQNLSEHHGVGFIFEVGCADCGAQLPRRYKVEFSLTDGGDINPLYDDRKQAVDDWNKREV